MIESLLFLFFSIVGSILLITSLIFLVFGIINTSSKLKKIAIGTGIASSLCFGIIVFWYKIAIPSFNKTEFNNYAGVYQLQTIERITENHNSKFELFANGTYNFTGDKSIGLSKKGTWKTGGIDGNFEFYDANENLIEYATPLDENGSKKIIFDLYNSNEKTFVKR